MTNPEGVVGPDAIQSSEDGAAWPEAMQSSEEIASGLEATQNSEEIASGLEATQNSEEVAPWPTATPDESALSSETKQKSTESVCGVCQEAPPKYKCSKCLLPYCSVACNKIHRETHPTDPDPPMPKSNSPVDPWPAEPEAETIPSAVDSKNPFQVLDSASDKLQMLFTKYPSLPRQLADIHAAMQPPEDTSQNSAIPASLLKGLPSRRNAWNHDIGIQRGKEALRKARKADGSEGEAVREYCELILYLMNGQDGNDATTVLQKEMESQDTQLIERLMAEEVR